MGDAVGVEQRAQPVCAYGRTVPQNSGRAAGGRVCWAASSVIPIAVHKGLTCRYRRLSLGHRVSTLSTPCTYTVLARSGR